MLPPEPNGKLNTQMPLHISRVAFPDKTEIGYNEDISLLELHHFNPASVNMSIGSPNDSRVTGAGSFNLLAFPRGIGNMFLPNGRSGVYIQTETEKESLLTIPRGGEATGSSGGLIYDSFSGKAVGMAICITEENTVQALRLDRLVSTLEELKENLKPEMPRNLRFLAEEGGCGPIGGRGLPGDG